MCQLVLPAVVMAVAAVVAQCSAVEVAALLVIQRRSDKGLALLRAPGGLLDGGKGAGARYIGLGLLSITTDRRPRQPHAHLASHLQGILPLRGYSRSDLPNILTL